MTVCASKRPGLSAILRARFACIVMRTAGAESLRSAENCKQSIRVGQRIGTEIGNLDLFLGLRLVEQLKGWHGAVPSAVHCWKSGWVRCSLRRKT